MTDATDTSLTHAAEPPATSYASGGWSAERIFIWACLIAAFAFWVPYMIVIDHGMWVAHQ